MKITKKFYPYFFLIIFIFIAVGNFCFARKLEVIIPGLPNNPGLIDYRNVLFNFLVGLGGTLAVLSLVIGAIKWMTSAGNPTNEGEARKRIVGSIFGLVLLLSSYLIMKTINPQLVATEVVPGLPITFGVFLTDGKEKTPCPESVADISTLPTGFNQITYECGGISPDKKPILWIRKFPQLNLGGWTDASAKVDEIKCDSSPVSVADAKSFILDIERTGLYLYNKSGASATDSRSMQILSSQSKMDDMYKKNTKSFKVINNPNPKNPNDPKESYGALFHEEINGEGRCSDFFYSSVGATFTKNLTISPSSFDFVQLNPEPLTSGDGITFYNKGLGNKPGTKAGHYGISGKNIIAPLIQFDPKKVVFYYDDVAGVTDEEKKVCKTFQDCPGSIEIKGDYLVIFSTPEGYCQSFRTSYEASNIISLSWLILSGRKLDNVIVVPIK